MSASNVRRRGTTKTTQEDPISRKVDAEDEGPVISLLDICRILLTLFVASTALSYYLTSGESFIWGLNPWFAKPGALLAYVQGPILLSPTALALYNGTDSALPIYLSINRTIFDVSASPHTYGLGGSYHAFAGHDATRAFVTGCFAEDNTLDLRGAEEVYMYVEDPDNEEEQKLSSGEKKTRAERERREAKKKVQKEVEKWVNFYRNNKKYTEVGELVDVPATFEGEPPQLCAHAQKGRPRRRKHVKQTEQGKPVQ